MQAPDFWKNRRGLALLLYPLSLVFTVLVWLRRLSFRARLTQSDNTVLPVIVVGNITVGGAGKTPLVIALVEQLQRRGWQPAIVSRGYGGSASVPTLVERNTDPSIVGDEALMLARRTGVPVAVCAKRVDAAQLLASSCMSDVIVSDDGLQHYALQRQVEICVIDSVTGLGNGWCLPAGPLRELPSRLREVDLIVFSGNSESDEKKDSVSLTITEWLDDTTDTDSKPQLAAYKIRVQAVVNLKTPSVRKSLAEFYGRKVHAVAAIGRPDKFFRQLRAAGLDIIEHAFSDHHVFQLTDLDFDDGFPVLMTEKDSVKCEKWALANFWTVNVAAELDSGIVDAVLTRLPHRVKTRRTNGYDKKQDLSVNGD